MKCFLVYAEANDWDQYDSVAVLADSEEEVKAMFHHEDDEWASLSKTIIGEDKCAPYFYDHQGKIHIEEMTEKGVVCASFNAG